MLEQDLQANHFLSEYDTNKPNNGLRLSDQFSTRPQGGFFRIYSPDTSTNTGNSVVLEGVDENTLTSSRATTHYLHFTSILPGGPTQYVAPIGGGTTTSPAAEIAYFLDVNNPTGYANNTPLYNLIRRQRLVAITVGSLLVNAPLDSTSWTIISMPAQNSSQINALADLVAIVPTNNRLRPYPHLPALTGSQMGDDVLLSNVISFEVKVHGSGLVNGSGQPIWPHPFTPGQFTDNPFEYLPPNAPPSVNGFAFDSGNLPVPNSTSGLNLPPPLRVRGLQIRLRIWDPRLQNARQITVVQDM